MSSWSWPLAILLLLVLPSARLHVFDGIPFSDLWEFAAFFLIVPLFASRALRLIYARPLEWRRAGAGTPRPMLPTLFGAALLLAICAKLVLLAVGDRSGFAACYHTEVARPDSPTCERSYENLFFRGGVTRFDDTIAFSPTTWNLTYHNSIRFNYYWWVKGNYDRNRLPFSVQWRGEIDQPAPTPITVTYAGEGTLRIAGLADVRLPPAYHGKNTVTLTVPDGRRSFALDYRFDDGLRTIGEHGLPPTPGPYAGMRVQAGTELLRTFEPALAWRAVGGFVDLTIVGVLCSLVWCYARLLRRDVALAGAACVGGALLAIDPTVTMRAAVFVDRARYWGQVGVPTGIGLTLFAAALLVWIVRRPSTRLLLLAYLAIGWASAFRQDFLIRGYHTVLSRDAGGDWMTYESFARAILETGSLEAGESAFFYQAFFRYILFVMHALFGDGDTLTALFAQAVMIWSLIFMSARLLPRGKMRAWRALGIAIALLLAILITSEPIKHLTYVGASEYPTWIMLPLLFPGLTVATSRRDWWFGTVVTGLSLITRMNHAIALGWLFLLHLWRIVMKQPRFAVQSTVALVAICALPTAHNLYYAGQFSVLPAEHALEATLPMPPSRWLRVFDDPKAHDQAVLHLGNVTYTNRTAVYTVAIPTDEAQTVFLVAMRGLQIAWGFAAILLFTTRARTQGLVIARLLLIMPALYLAVHLFYQVRDYHPRFIITGYFAMGAVAMLAVRERARARRPSSRRPISTSAPAPDAPGHHREPVPPSP
jgi:hypothetical protein